MAWDLVYCISTFPAEKCLRSGAHIEGVGTHIEGVGNEGSEYGGRDQGELEERQKQKLNTHEEGFHEGLGR